MEAVTRLTATGDWWASGRIPEGVCARPETAAALGRLRAADLAFLNLETPLSIRGLPAEKWVVLRAQPDLVEDLLVAGVDVVSLANNHVLDYGPDGLEDTLGTLERAGIRQVGAGPTVEAARDVVVLDGPGGSLAFLAFASTLPQGSAASPLRPGIAPIHVTSSFVVENPRAHNQPGSAPPVVTFPLKQDVEAAAKVVSEVKSRADFVVVSSHWGVADQDALADYQLEVGHALVDAGADLILGHHPHRLQGIELYRGRLIFYSLGHFVFEPFPPGSDSPYLSFRGRLAGSQVHAAMRPECLLVEALVRGERLEKLTLAPVVRSGEGYPALRGDRAVEFASLLERLSEGMGTRFDTENGSLLVRPR